MNQYLKWLSGTASSWWNDSADINELNTAMESGASGVTTNPYLVGVTLRETPEAWREALNGMLKLTGGERAEELIRRVTGVIAARLKQVYDATDGKQGYACAQVNPRFPGDVDVMLPMAKRLSGWAPNIAVKLPVTQAGLEVLEECAALGITVTATVSFTVAQALAIAERYERGVHRAHAAGIKPGRCFAVLMVGRLDDYLRDVAHDCRAAVSEEDIRSAGIAVAKRAYGIFRERGYGAVIMPAALRGAYHATALSGADMVFSVHPSIQKQLAEMQAPFSEGIGEPVDRAVLKRLLTMPDFVRAYEPDALKTAEFISYGAEQKTLTQFVEAGWSLLERFTPPWEDA
jgi:transaldolase